MFQRNYVQAIHFGVPLFMETSIGQELTIYHCVQDDVSVTMFLGSRVRQGYTGYLYQIPTVRIEWFHATSSDRINR